MLELGILKTFNTETHKAGVQLVGSLTTYLDDIAVATNIAPEAMTVGNYVLVAIPGGNPRDACVVASWPAGSSGVTDHGDLDGLTDDDHSQYLNIARHDLVARHPLAVLDSAVCSETEADSKITTHKNNASAHHTKTDSSEIDHGSVQGLADDDHSQYLNTARHDLTARHPLGTVVPHESALNNIGNVNVPAPADNDVPYWDNAAGLWKCKAPVAGGWNASLTFVIDGGGEVITTGQKGHLKIPFACTIKQVTMLADQSGSIVVDIWKDTYANFPPTDADSITASAPPTISSSQKSQDSTLTGWTKSISSGAILAFNVDSCATITRVTISLKVERS